jgi:hypothetical protein
MNNDIKSEFISSITSNDKEGFWGDIHQKYGDLREIKRNGLFRYEIFKLMKYTPHAAQRKFHDAIPRIEEVQRKEGNDPDCDHPEFDYLINPKDPAQTTRRCMRCDAEFRNIYHNRFKCVIAAARWGKSLAVGKEGVLPLLWPGINADGSLNREKAPRAYVYAPSYSIGRHEFNYVCQGMEEIGLSPERYQYSPNTGNLYAKWPWGAEIMVKSFDNPKSILGDEIDCAIFAEASTLPNLIFERYIRARMGSRMAYGILGSTPHGIGEFLEGLYWRGQDPKDVEVWSESFSIMSNPHHPIEDVEEARAMLDPRTFAEQYEGKFVSMAGLVFDTFDRDIHLKPQIQDPKKLPRGSQVVFSIDFGRTAPTGAVMAYWDKDGALHIIGEYYVKGKTIKQHFNEFLKDWILKWQPEWMVFDFAQIDAAQFLQDEIAALEEEGLVDFNRLKMIPCKKGKKNGIERVRQLLHYNPKTEQSLFEADPSCENLIFEFLHYANKKAPDGRIIDEPAQGHDHICDSIEYLVATSYEDAELRRDRLKMLDMSAEKPARQIHQMFKDRMREEAEAAEEELNDEVEWLESGDEDDDRECYMDFDGEE